VDARLARHSNPSVPSELDGANRVTRVLPPEITVRTEKHNVFVLK
jgi:hypothetical protein